MRGGWFEPGRKRAGSGRDELVFERPALLARMLSALEDGAIDDDELERLRTEWLVRGTDTPVIGVTGTGFTIALWVKTSETAGGNNSPWYGGHGLVDGDLP